MKKIDERVIEHDGNHIAEIVVIDETAGNKFFVTCQVGDLFYRTFKSSYIDYVIKGGEKPGEVEGEDHLFFSLDDEISPYGEKNTPFRDFYREALSLACGKQKEDYLKNKYSSLEKPRGNIKFEIVSKKCEDTSCGPCFGGCEWEIEFFLPNHD